MAASDTAPASSGGNVLTRKLGPLPTWAWLAIATGAGLLYYIASKKKTAAAASTSSSTTSPTSTATSASNVPDYVFQNYNEIPPTTPPPAAPPTAPPATAPTTPPAQAAPTAPTQSGSGYYVPGSTTPVTAGGATYQWVNSQAQANSVISSGGQLYVQTSPGVFVPWGVASGSVGGTLAPGTPLFQQVNT
jgi:hypothetical protein